MNLPIESNPASGPVSTRMFGEDLILVSSIESTRNQIYEVFSIRSMQKYILKAFPYSQNDINAYYFNESRFSNLMHPHIVSFKEAKDCAESFDSKKISYILTEFVDFKFLEFLRKGGLSDEKLCRNILHQLVSGVGYLHSHEIAHMDIKLDNILISKDFEVKIIDFDLAYKRSDLLMIGTGTQGYRAPELRDGLCEDGQAADIYSLGIMMFAVLFGRMPYSEEVQYKGYDLKNLLWNNPEEFWRTHAQIDERVLSVSDDFKSLFNSMTRFEPCDRIKIEDVKKNRWYMKPLYPLKQYKLKMKELLSP